MPASFWRKDYLEDAEVPLREAVFNLVKPRTGQPPPGPVHLLMLLRNFGYYFGPLNLYFCFDRDGNTVAAVVADVANTPWL